MDDKHDNQADGVKVNGHYVSEIDTAVATQRIYHYQVTIGHAEKNQQRDYERELHICERHPQPTAAAPQSDTAPAGYAVTPVPSTAAPEQADPQATVQTAPQAKAGQAWKVLARLKPRLPVLRLPAWLSRPGTLVKKIRPGALLTLPDIRKRLARPKFNWQRWHSIFAAVSPRRVGIATAVLAGLVLIAALLSGFPRHKHQTMPSQAVKPAPVATLKRHKIASDYHAVIEKTPDGVVITIQGPHHDEVLTQLPPGYHPIVEGNKIVHIVTAGNTLWFIAKRYIKDPYRYPELARLNQIKNPDLIYPGDRVVIQYIRRP